MRAMGAICAAKELKKRAPNTMTKDQDNIVTMFDTAIAFLDENNSLWSATRLLPMR
jgi:hypothetical protein